ncbi:MAG: dTDP-4-dehydrorhamnose 3,5-epimerase [Bacteroidetes bacterium]|nr:MAG: dTDP-4-dehydrorhamnose 3,5-epimerase [Bacteroidota bacterium]
MIFTETFIKGLFVIEPKVFGDSRGYFMETFKLDLFQKETGFSGEFVQENESMSSKNVLRGLHFQKPPFAQGKLVRVVQGSVLDVAVDIRKGSPTYGQYYSILLSAENKKQFWIPEGFAHGFASLEDQTIFQYKCTNFYSPENEGCISWNDHDLGISWEIDDPNISEKDKNGVPFRDFISPF